MTFPSILFDSHTIPIPVCYVPGYGFVAMMSSPNTGTDGQGNQYAPLAVDLNQIGDVPAQMAGSDGVTATNVLQVVTSSFNGRTIDQNRSNQDSIIILSASNVTAPQTSVMQTNYNHRGCIVVLQTTSIGTGSITLSINGFEPQTNYSWTILSGSPVTTNTTILYKIHPSLPPAYLGPGSGILVAQDILPRSWYVSVAANNANPTTYGVYGIMAL